MNLGGSSNDYRQVESLFQRAMDLSPEQRVAFLDHQCGSDPALRRDVETLIRHHAAVHETYLSPAFDDSGPALPSMEPPRRIGHYEIIRLIGQGGMGVVFEARQESPRRNVAVKVIRSGFASGEALRRFEYESAILARLQHPGIAHVYEAGTAEITPGVGGASQPYFAMELVRGQSLTHYASDQNLDIRARLELFIKVCEAVEHAHQKGVIHRDLKPANILVDEAGQPKILDFGVARVTSSDFNVLTTQTGVGQLVGTPTYMSPEQLSGDPRQIDTRSDIYAIGVVLYELLVGRCPFDARDLSVTDALRRLREDKPPRPSSIHRALRGDLETIIDTALAKDAARRYQSASALAEDIRRYLTHQPIAARPASAVYQLRKFAQRHTAWVIGAAAFLLALLGGIAGISLALTRAWEAEKRERGQRERAEAASTAADTARDRAEAERDRAQQVAEFLEETLKGVQASVAMGRDKTMLKDMLDKAADRLRKGELKAAPLADLHLRLAITYAYRELGDYEAAETMLEPAMSLATALTPEGGDSREMALTLFERARLLQERGQAVEAEPLFVQCLEMHRRINPGDHLQLANSLTNVAGVWQELGRATEAEPMYVQALEMYRRLHPPDHADVALGLNNLANVRHVLGRYAEAETLYQQSLDMYRRVHNGDHPEIARTSSNLACVYMDQDRFADAERMFRETLELRQRIYETDHTLIGQAMNNLATSLVRLGRSADAEPLLHRAVELRRLAFAGKDHGELATSLNNLAYVRESLDRWEEAERTYDEALEMTRRLYPDDHPTVAVALRNLAMVRRKLGRAAGAETLLEQALAMYTRLFPADHPDIVSTLNNLGIVRQALDKLPQAEAAFRQALDLNQRANAGDHPLNAGGLTNLASVSLARGELDASASLYRQALDMRRRLYPSDHPSVAVSLVNLANVLVKGSALAEAEPLLRDAVAMRARLFPDGHSQVWLTFDARSRLGGVLVAVARQAPSASRPAPIEPLLEAESLLLDAFEQLSSNRRAPRPIAGTASVKREALERIIELYDVRHGIEPDAGYELKASEWRSRLDHESPRNE